jgi:hypothetical protein
VHSVSRSCLAIVLSAALTGVAGASPVANPSSRPIGTVLQAERSNEGVNATSGGATIYDGETLQTDGSGSLRALLGASQMYLRSDTVAQVRRVATGYSASLSRGTVVLSTGEGELFQLVADGATIHPVGNRAATAQVSIISPTQLLLTSTRGAFEISMGDEVKTIDAGTSYRLEVQPDEPADPPQPQGRLPRATGQNRFQIFLISAIAVGTAAGITRALVSPSGP